MKIQHVIVAFFVYYVAWIMTAVYIIRPLYGFVWGGIFVLCYGVLPFMCAAKFVLKERTEEEIKAAWEKTKKEIRQPHPRDPEYLRWHLEQDKKRG